MLAFGKAYNYDKEFTSGPEKKLSWLPLKSNVLQTVLKTVSVTILRAKQPGVVQAEKIEVTYK